MTPSALTRTQKLWLTLALAIVLWLPRGLELDRFVAVDERSWLTRSGNFYLALTQGDWAATFQRYHPGVTTMWLGMAGFLTTYPGYPTDAAGQVSSMSDGIEDFLREQGYSPMRLLAAGRSFMVLAIVGLLLLAFWLAVDVIGWLPALTGMVLLGFEPQVLGLTRMLHVDGLSATLMLVAVLAYLRYRTPEGSTDSAIGGQRRDLLLSGAMAGLAWLTKSPTLFLIPFIGLVALIDLARAWWMQGRTERPLRGDGDSGHGVGIPLGASPTGIVGRTLRALALWGVVAALIFMALWPAMWVQPLASLQAIFSAAGESATQGHSKEIYFQGEIVSGDPGAHFYPLVYLWSTTPITLIGLGLALVAGLLALRRAKPPMSPMRWQNVALLALYALAFTAFMTLGSKKFTRYLLPAMLPLDLVAGAGWSALAFGLLGQPGQYVTRWLLPAALAIHAALALPHFPYYFTYTNPLLGGNARAAETLMIGLGEGLDEAARYLNAKPDAADLTVAAWYRGGSFNYIFQGRDVDIEEFYRADYAVLYAHQWQRQVPSAQLLDYFATLPAEHVVSLHGMEYAWVYDLRTAPPPSYFTDWAGAIRLVQTQILPAPTLRAGDDLVVRLRLYVIGTLETNLNVVVRLVDAGGNEVGRSEGWPFGSPTSTWKPDEVYVDGHEFTLPPDLPPGYLRVEAAFYNADTQALVTPTVAGTATPRPDFAPVGYLAVGQEDAAPVPLEPAPMLGNFTRLVGAQVDNVDLAATPIQLVTRAGATLPLLLAWQPLRPAPVDYTLLLHLVGPDGVPVAQWDRPPLQDIVGTTLWREGDTLLDVYDLTLPADLPPGEYRLITGLYDLATLQRLPVQLDGSGAGPGDSPGTGDTIHLATLVIRP